MGALTVVALVVALLAIAVAAGPLAPDGPSHGGEAASVASGGATAASSATGRDAAFGAALSFLARYERPGGRVVRWDQGGDTVSEGEAYAMLLSVAAGDRARFDAAWDWTRTHLLEPSGLLAWHWADGRVTSLESAADADVDAAYALELAAGRFGEPADHQAAVALGSAVVAGESVVAPGGRILVAGPWAVGPPSYANPSYASPAELAALGALAPLGPAAAALSAGTRALVGRVMAAHALPPDWVELEPSGPVVVAPPGQGPFDGYGFDAVRLPIRWAASCDVADRRVAAALWPTLRRRTLFGQASVGLTLDGGAGPEAQRAPVGLVAAAAAAWAAGASTDAWALLGRAQAQNRRHPTYYSSAWVALGRVYLQTDRLGTCAVS